jgi:hypothetical protein
MQILKGEHYKSVTVENILKNTKSYCVVYHNMYLSFGDYYIDSNKNTINQLWDGLQEIKNEKNSKITQYNYFILYTNIMEEEVSKLINWLKDKELDFNCKCILITCI